VRLGLLLFAAFVAILLVSFSYPASLIAARLRMVYLESAEEPLADTANILAELAGEALERGDFQPDALYDTAGRVASRALSAQIYEVLKERVDLDVYITDESGKVLFDSRGKDSIGADFSRWRDVSLTLAGRYGARVGGFSSGDNSDSSLPRVLYVAAPIMLHGVVAGSLTVAKPTSSVSRFLQSVRPRLIMLGLFAIGCATTLAFVMSLWLTEQLRRLIRYADDVREGRRVPFPKLARTELLQMGLAFERMRVTLAGQAYIEQYVRALTHEIKSPISAIRGAAEILETPSLEPAQRARFLGNIQHESLRIQDLVDRMLELSELEVRRALPERVSVALGPVVRTIVESLQPMLTPKQLRVALELEADASVRGDGFLLHMALSNLIKNAVEFSPHGGCVRVRCRREDAVISIEVEDEGPGVPDFARERIFERFYSLARPDTGRKSTGLGLNFVKEIAALHHGEVRVNNREPRGLCARLTLPAG
jgi:two-component system, OmpR family, sensor histidine kinase CreC